MTSEDGEKSSGRSGRRSKVARIIDEYDLTEMDDGLVRLWTGENGERRSLRDLAEYVNHAILEAAMADAGMNLLEGEAENTYRLLTDDDVSSGMQIEAETTLERNGIDTEALTNDFISHQAVHTYLTKHRGIEGPNETESRDQIEKTVETVQRLQNRLIAVAEKSLRSLCNTGRITLGNFNVFVDVRVLCEDCGTQSELPELLRAGGCDCKK